LSELTAGLKPALLNGTRGRGDQASQRGRRSRSQQDRMGIERARRNRGRRALRSSAPRPGVQGWIQATENEPTRTASPLTQTRRRRRSCASLPKFWN